MLAIKAIAADTIKAEMLKQTETIRKELILKIAEKLAK